MKEYKFDMSFVEKDVEKVSHNGRDIKICKHYYKTSADYLKGDDEMLNAFTNACITGFAKKGLYFKDEEGNKVPLTIENSSNHIIGIGKTDVHGELSFTFNREVFLVPTAAKISIKFGENGVKVLDDNDMEK